MKNDGFLIYRKNTVACINYIRNVVKEFNTNIEIKKGQNGKA